ncbi:MAG TPA: HD domain-containing protein [Coriobacteriia bacterium]|nr:HD domain-containing protein [Coriobacteriia bacterium]
MTPFLTVITGSAIWFGLAILLLDVFESSLEEAHGTHASVALIAATAVLAGWQAAVAWGLAGVILAVVAQRSYRGSFTALLVVRLSVVTVAGIVVVLAGPAIGAVPLILMAAGAAVLTETVGMAVRQAISDGLPAVYVLASAVQQRALLLAAQVCLAALTVVLYGSMHAWALLPVLALFVLTSQSYSMLLDIRRTYRTTLMVLVEAAEAAKPDKAGHSERVAAIAHSISARCGLRGRDIERVGFAALLHDIGEIADEWPDNQAGTRSAASVVEHVGFLSDVLPVLAIIDGIPDPSGEQPSERDLLAAYVVALASDIDGTVRDDLDEGVTEAAALAPLVPARVKARVVAAALRNGYPVPAID